MPRLHMHWKNNNLFNKSKISEIMSRDRFFLILSFLRLNNDEYNDNTDKIYKIRPLVNKLISNYKNYYSLGCRICIDEKMIKFTGRSHMK